MDKSKQNKYEILFEQMLRQLHIEVYRLGAGVYRLYSDELCLDEKQIYRNAQDIVESLEWAISDTFFGDLAEKMMETHIIGYNEGWTVLLNQLKDWKENGSMEHKKFVEDHQWEIDVCNMVAFHVDEVDMEYIETTVEPYKEVFYVTLKETYYKTVAIIAKDEESATDQAMELLNTGKVRCDNYEEDSTRLYVEDKAKYEAYYLNAPPELYDEDGEEI